MSKIPLAVLPREKASQQLAGVRILALMPSIPVQGMERSNLQILRMMRERGADVLFITHRNYGDLIQQEVERIGCRWSPASFEKRLHLPKNLRETAALLCAWANTAREVDEIYRKYRPSHIYVTNLSSFLYALPTIRRAKEPVIFRLPNPPDTTLSGIRRKLSDWIWRHCIEPLSDLLVCNSRHTLRQLRTIGLSTEKITVISNCVPERIPLQKSDAPEIKGGRFNIVYLGRIRPEKGVRELFATALKLIGECDEVDFYLVGEHHWQNPFAESLIRQVEEGGLSSRIRILHPIQDIFGLLSSCHLHVCPSISDVESFPNVVLEAKSQGVPSVVFPTAGLPEAVTHLEDGYICRDRSAEALYEGIRYFLDDHEALRAAGKAAKQSMERFSKRRIADEWIDVFRSCRKGFCYAA